MPRSPSPRRNNTKLAPTARNYWSAVLIGIVAVLAVIIVALPASIVARFLPPAIHAEDFSGTIWHGSAGKISLEGHDAGALEWTLHPLSFLGLAVSADVHWVKVSFVIDAAVKVDGHGATARAVRGGGAIEDLRDLGVEPGWHGTAEIHFSVLQLNLERPIAAVGDVRLSSLTAAQIADATDLGGYDLRLPEGAVGGNGDVTAQLADTGGPLEVQAVIHYSASERTGILTGTLRERPSASAALRSQLENLSQLRGRDPQGRLPLDFELRF